MPVGVPKVPFRIPGDEEASWVDLYNRIYRQRLLFLFKELDTETSNHLCGLMVYLSLEDSTKDLHLFVNCPGGWIIPGIALYDVMQTVKADVQTIGLGVAASMGSFILTGGTITKRLALPNVRVMVHQPASVFCRERTAEFVMEIGQISKMRFDIAKTYTQRTGQPLFVIFEDLDRDYFMSAEEAKAHGIVDLVAADKYK
uniref:ATP-dependent Clp protease proteolytic subunit n=1 Tax=Faidherbia albida TaxID=138055 RepID=A0A1Z1CEP5_9FABA|nr:clp protease proteolytic subunit [Faidherbia albida]APA33104.1 clp protease proteolytic subunit [Faidherbia albida]ATO89171.1 ATP-dependent Clp protease proteolytic subunit [Faidherbia albida]